MWDFLHSHVAYNCGQGDIEPVRGDLVGATDRIGRSGVTDWGTTLLGCFDVQAPLQAWLGSGTIRAVRYDRQTYLPYRHLLLQHLGMLPTPNQGQQRTQPKAPPSKTKLRTFKTPSLAR